MTNPNHNNNNKDDSKKEKPDNIAFIEGPTVTQEMLDNAEEVDWFGAVEAAADNANAEKAD